MKRFISIGVLCCFVLTSFVGHADSKLERVERAAEKNERKRHHEHDHDHDHHHHRRYHDPYDDAGDIVAASLIQTFLELFFNFAALGPFTGLDESMSWSERHQLLRDEYHPTLPTFRLETSYQPLPTQDVQGYRVNATLGYLGIGADVDFIHYFERNPSTQLKIISPHFLLRSAPLGPLQIDLAIGAKVIQGRRTHTAFEIGAPMYIFLGDHAILDFKAYGAFLNNTKIVDLSAGITGKWKMGGVRASYRMIDVGGETLHGPEIGLVLQW